MVPLHGLKQRSFKSWQLGKSVFSAAIYLLINPIIRYLHVRLRHPDSSLHCPGVYSTWGILRENNPAPCFASNKQIHETTLKITDTKMTITFCSKWVIPRQRDIPVEFLLFMNVKTPSVVINQRRWIQFQPWGAVCPHLSLPKLLSQNTGKRILWATAVIVTKYTNVR